MSICGVAYEYVYIKQGETEIAVRNLEPDHTFLVYDDTIEQNLLLVFIIIDTRMQSPVSNAIVLLYVLRITSLQ